MHVDVAVLEPAGSEHRESTLTEHQYKRITDNKEEALRRKRLKTEANSCHDRPGKGMQTFDEVSDNSGTEQEGSVALDQNGLEGQKELDQDSNNTLNEQQRDRIAANREEALRRKKRKTEHESVHVLMPELVPELMPELVLGSVHAVYPSVHEPTHEQDHTSMPGSVPASVPDSVQDPNKGTIMDDATSACVNGDSGGGVWQFCFGDELQVDDSVKAEVNKRKAEEEHMPRAKPRRRITGKQKDVGTGNHDSSEVSLSHQQKKEDRRESTCSLA